MQDETLFLERVHQRAAEITRQSIRRKLNLMQAVSAAAGIAAVVVTALMIPEAMPETEHVPVTMQASIFSESGSLGYIVVGIIAFLLGAGVTLLCIRLRQYFGKQEAQREQHDRDR
ncbi:MAG: hypothetical protein IKH27_04080 [Oscillospiraceae bacterium]|nr:hypothetical protein [Oscillospiraceae bacterium]